MKAFPPQLEILQRQNQSLLDQVLATVLPRGSRRHVVHVRRRDRLAQTVSYARASLSGVWRKEQERGALRPVEYSQEALEAAERGIALQEATWEQMFGDLGVEPLSIWFEDALENPTKVQGAVADYLAISIDPSAAFPAPKIEKQAEGEAHQWAERFAETRGASFEGFFRAG